MTKDISAYDEKKCLGGMYSVLYIMTQSHIWATIIIYAWLFKA